jgi:hypothetical protein
MIRNEDSNWSRLELLCLLTLTSLNQAETGSIASTREPLGEAQPSMTDDSNDFGGRVSAPASALAVSAIGNAFAKATMPTTAGVIPVYSSADCI